LLHRRFFSPPLSKVCVDRPSDPGGFGEAGIVACVDDQIVKPWIKTKGHGM
jgi:hypothetical protein